MTGSGPRNLKPMSIPLYDLALSSTGLNGDQLRHLQRLVGNWQLLADLCFSDLLLVAPVDVDNPHRFMVLAHVRPTTGPTLYPAELVGTVVQEVERPVMTQAWQQRVSKSDFVKSLLDGEEFLGVEAQARSNCIPVYFDGEVIAIVDMESSLESGRKSGELERHYLEVFDKFAVMISEGSFPFDRDEIVLEEGARVADGVIVTNENYEMLFASPNAVSVFHRFGIHAFALGTRIQEVGVDQVVLERARLTRLPEFAEVEQGEVSILIQAIPLISNAEVVNLLVLVRDVSDLRRRDRMLLSKDAMIREIHHRVKNNLQTIAALLRLQGRRLESAEAREAIEEAQRRVRSIAIVHETLSRETSDTVEFMEIIQPLVGVVQETVSSAEQQLEFSVEGDVGVIPGAVATVLAVILNELMQNAVDHAFPYVDGEVSQGKILISIDRIGEILEVRVSDSGVGFPPGFVMADSEGMGLSIVRTLIRSELGGSIEINDSGVPGAEVTLRIPFN